MEIQMELDFKSLTPEQEKILREILVICHYFQQATRWVPAVSDDVFAKQAREIAWKMAKLEKVSAASVALKFSSGKATRRGLAFTH
jgi:hypothetical protein